MKTRMDDRARVDRLLFLSGFSQAARNGGATGNVLSLAPSFSRELEAARATDRPWPYHHKPSRLISTRLQPGVEWC